MQTGKKNVSLRSVLILEGTLAALCLVIFRRFLLRGDLLIYEGAGSDTRQQYIMWFHSIANHLRSGSFPLWDFTNGLGGSMYNYYLFQLPLVAVYGLGALFGPSHIPGMMVYLEIGEILLSGLVCYLLLCEWDFADPARILTAILYAFNGYFTVWGQHYGLAFVSVTLPLLLLTVEKTIKKATWAFGVALSAAFVILSGYYQGYMVILAVALYVTIRVLIGGPGRFWERGKTYLAIGFAMGFGVLMGAVNLLPSAGSLAVTSRLDQGGSLLSRALANLSFYPKDYYVTLGYRLLGNNLQGVGRYYMGYANYYEAPNLSMGSFVLMLLVQFVPLSLKKKRPLREHAAILLGAALCLFMLLIKAGSWVFNGFAYAFSRHTFLVLPVFALAACFAFSEILRTKKINLPLLACSVALFSAGYLRAAHRAQMASYQKNARILLGCLLLEGGLLLLFALRQGRVRAFSLLLCIPLLTGLGFDVFLCYNNRETVSKYDPVYFGTYEGDTAKALAWIRSQDDQFYRVEKDYGEAAYYLDSMAQGYGSVTTYNAQQNSNVQRMVRALMPQLLTGYDNNHYDFRSLLQDSPIGALLGVKYVLSHQDAPLGSDYELIHQEGSVYVFRNHRTQNIARFYSAALSEKQYRKNKDALLPEEVTQTALITQGKTGYSLTKQELTAIQKQELDVAQVTGQKLSEFTDRPMAGTGGITIPISPKAFGETKALVAELTLSSDRARDYRVYLGEQCPVAKYGTGDVDLRVVIPEGSKSLLVTTSDETGGFRLKTLRFYQMRQLQSRDQAKISVPAPGRDDRVSLSAAADTDGIVLLAIPYQEGWEASLDGEQTQLMRVDYGLTGIAVPAGEHEIVLSYHAPLFREGLLLSIVTWMMWAALLIIVTLFTAHGALRRVEKDRNL